MFKTMKQDTVLSIISKYSSNIRSEVEREDKFIANLSCRNCGGSMIKSSPKVPQFLNGMPKNWARCTACNTEIEPYTGIQINMPNYTAYLN